GGGGVGGGEAGAGGGGKWGGGCGLDSRGHREDPEVAQALEHLLAAAAFCKILGSYPCALG
ncbi:MAG: hypothetical protein OXF94_11620, partial [Gammaproteobacteria bacterium]|nr:hypothetical protein [Gammaproteobacteria bacterium]